MTTGQRIKMMRTQKRITQKELAEKLLTSQQNLAQYENDKRNPKFETVLKIASALGCNVSDLYPITDVTTELEREYAPEKNISNLQEYLESLGYTIFREEIIKTVKKDSVDFELSNKQNEMLDKYGHVMVSESPYYIRKELDAFRLTEKQFKDMEKEVITSIEFQLWKYLIKK